MADKEMTEAARRLLQNWKNKGISRKLPNVQELASDVGVDLPADKGDQSAASTPSKKAPMKSPKTKQTKKVSQGTKRAKVAPMKESSFAAEEAPPPRPPVSNKMAAPQAEDPFYPLSRDLPKGGEPMRVFQEPPAMEPPIARAGKVAAEAAGLGRLGLLGGIAGGMLIPSSIAEEDLNEFNLPSEMKGNPVMMEYKGPTVMKSATKVGGRIGGRKLPTQVKKTTVVAPDVLPQPKPKSDSELEQAFEQQLMKNFPEEFNKQQAPDGSDLEDLITETDLRETARGHKTGEYPDISRRGGPINQPKKRPVILKTR